MAPLRPARTAILAVIPIVSGIAVAAAVTWLGSGRAPAAHVAHRVTSRSAPAAGEAPVTVAAPGGGPGSPLADLTGFTPVQVFNVSQVSAGPVRIGDTTYADSVRFSCDDSSHMSSGDMDYVVTGYRSLTTTLVVIPGRPGAASVSFFNNGSGSQVAGPYQVSPGHAQAVTVRFPAASQLEVSCTPADARSRDVRLALANPVLASH